MAETLLQRPRLTRSACIVAAAGLLASACDPREWRGWRADAETIPLDSAALRADSVLVGAGDIASCDADGDEATAALLDSIPGTVFTTGDNVYPYGSPATYRECYGPSWGRHRWRTRPAPGDHDHSSAYYAYFGEAAGPRGRGYYTFRQAGWEVIVLNTNLPIHPASEQYAWLDAQLQATRVRCRVVVTHEPLLSSGAKQGSSPRLRAAWRLMQQHGVDVALAGHSHIYERFPRVDALGRPDSMHGIRLFVVGTGGRYLHGLAAEPAPSEVRSASSFGVLKLTLRDGGYAWEFVPAGGAQFRDSGADACRA